ncbi:MAG: DUF6624 domain-containing protein [Bacteroidia bacterium]
MKSFQIILLMFMLIFGSNYPILLAQESIVFDLENFDQKILTYQAPHRTGVTDAKYKDGLGLLKEVQRLVKSEDNQFNYADYWNISTAFIRLGEPNEHVKVAFQKAINKNTKSTCELIEAFGVSRMQNLREAIPALFDSFVAKCEAMPKEEEEVFDAELYAQENGFDLALIKLMHQISINDQVYRGQDPVDWSKQTPLDHRNEEIIDSLFQVYDSYIGSDRVGKKMESTMWLVIQHSNIEKMQTYLPVVHQAVLDERLHATPLKMLLDRIYAITEGYQIFGSQIGVEQGEEAFCEAIRKKYGL